MPNSFDSIVANWMAYESTAEVRVRIASYDYMVYEDGTPMIYEICITPTLTPSSWYIDNA